jgi:signal transduction histidine kinase
MNDNRPKILIVDDEPSNHRVYERTLEPLDLEFVKAMSGQQALAVAHRHDFFLILMDVQMPGMDGFETASLILDHPKTCHIPVIFITAFARDEMFEFKGYASGAVDYLVKPINDEIVKSKVGVFLELYEEKIRLDNAYKIKKKAEEELREHKEHLEELVKERTDKLQQSLDNLMETQNQLVESEKMASLGRLVGGVAHELNTPIGICITAISHLQDETTRFNGAFLGAGLTKNNFSEYINASNQSSEIIASNLERASDLVRNFKLISVDSKAQLVHAFNLMEYVRNLMETLHSQIEPSDFEVEVTGDKRLLVATDPGILSQIITSLVTNTLIHAVIVNQPGKIVLDMRCEEKILHLTFSDDGKGMSEDISTMIFEPFFTTQRGVGGSGLGMYIVYNLVTQALGGDITCESSEGGGTVFNISFSI